MFGEGSVLITAFDPSAVQRAVYAKTVGSISDISADDFTQPIRFTEHETLRAFLQVGATPGDLIKMSVADRGRIPGTPNIRKRIADDLEQRRVETFRDVLDARNKLIAAAPRKNKPKRRIVIPRISNPYKQLKARQIATLMRDQSRRRTVAEADEVITKRIADRRREASEKVAAQHQQAATQISEKLARLKDVGGPSRDAERDRLEAARASDREEEQRRLLALEDELSEIPARHTKVRKEKSDEIDELKAMITRNEEEFRRSLEQLAPPPPPDNDPRPLGEIFLDIRAERHRQWQTALKQRIQDRASRVEANLRALSEQRERHLRAIRIRDEKRSQTVRQTKLEIERQRQEASTRAQVRQHEALARVAALRDSAAVKTEERRGESFARLENGQHNAKRVGIQKQFKAVVQAEKTIDRHNELTEREREEEEARIRAFRRVEIAKLREKDELLELRRVVVENPDADPAQLAEGFHVSMELVVRIQQSMEKKR
jgi:hypothetical protein